MFEVRLEWQNSLVHKMSRLQPFLAVLSFVVDLVILEFYGLNFWTLVCQ